jgi:hypothetical protein
MGHVNSAINSDTRSDLLVLGAVALIGYGVWQLGSGMLLRRRGAAESRDTDAQQDGHGCRDAR